MRTSLARVVLFAAFAAAVPMAPAAEVGIILAGTVQVFWQAMTKGIKRAGEDLQVDLVIRSPADGAALGAQDNVQLRMIDHMVQRGVAGIVLAPEPLVGVKTPVSIAVPTVLVDRGSADYDNALATVATDNFAAGRTAARSLAPVLRKGAKIAVLRLARSISSTTERENGFLSVARELGWDVVVDTYVGYQFRGSQELIEKALKGHVGRLDAVFAPNETTAYGSLRVVEAMPAANRPRLAVFDWRPEFRAALERGLLHVAVVQDPYRMGYVAVQTLLAARQGRSPPPKVFIDVVAVTQANMNDPAIAAVLANFGE